MWIMEATEPSIFVELGTHKGDSYAAFCQSVQELGLSSSCYAVDSWMGDEHSGLYGEEVFAELSAYNQRHFGTFSTLMRMMFNDALDYFDDGTIDLLHIDGYHTYEAVRDDFAKWLPKLSGRGVVLFHDIAVRERGFGVWRFWHEISERYPSVTFTHSNGLGLLGVGEELPSKVRLMIEAYQKEPSSVTTLVAALGNRSQLLGQNAVLRASEEELRRQVSENTTKIQLLTDERFHLTKDLMAHKELVDAQYLEIGELKERLAEANLDAARESLKVVTAVEEKKEILNSEAWRITAPLRSSVLLARRLQGWRRFAQPLALRLVPWFDLPTSTVTGAMVALGGKGRFVFEPPLPTPGWYVLEVQISECEEAYGLRAHVVAETALGERFSQQQRSETHGDRISVLFHTNHSVRRLELLIYGITGPFRLGEYTLRPALPQLSGVKGLLARRVLGGKVALCRIPELAEEQELLESESDHLRWCEVNEDSTPERLDALRKELDELARRPMISVLLPTYNSPRHHVVTAIESVRAQLYPEWELCISDDASEDEELLALLEAYVAADARIHLHRRDVNGNISKNTNDALSLAQGEYVALLDADDELAASALLHVAQALQSPKTLELVFSDEDKISRSGERSDPYFKPTLSPELMLTKNAVSHLSVFRRSTLLRLGGLRPEFDGAQDWDLTLRVMEQMQGDFSLSYRIPRVLYHWRTLHSSTATSTDVKGYAVEAGRRAVKEYLNTVIKGAEVVASPRQPTIARVVIPIPTPAPLVSILIPTTGAYNVIRTCLESLLALTTYENFEIVVRIDSATPPSEESLAYLRSVQARARLRFEVAVRGSNASFNYSLAMNALARLSEGEILVWLNDDTQITDGDWLREAVSILQIPGVGVVGAQLLYPGGTIQHSGVLLGMGGVAGHMYHNWPDGEPGYFYDLMGIRNVGAVTGACLVVSRSLFDAVGGLNESRLSIAFNDTDFCMKVLATGA
jgi:glycosyltransferase involved in cell wall biosynthesis